MTFKRKPIQISVALLGALALHSAQAASTFYGIMDAALEYGRFDPNKVNLWRVQSGSLQASRLGFKGDEDLGNGLSARYQLETEVKLDGTGNPNNSLFTRGTHIGLAGNFGSMDIGRLYMPLYWVYLSSDASTYGLANFSSTMSLQHNGVLGKKISGTGKTTRTATGGFFNNAIRYKTPQWGSITAEIGASAGEENGGLQSNEGRSYSANIIHKDQALQLGIGYLQYRYYATDTASDYSRHNTWIIGGQYVMDFATIGANFLHTSTSHDRWQANSWLLGAKIPVGRGDINIGTSRLIESADKTAQAFHLGYVHYLSKVTQLYGYTAYIRNNSHSDRGLAIVNPDTKYLSVPGYDPRAFTVGLRHGF
ncbi:porin [Neisseriaceae bacterium TC5R-5]|nr:porin [Neisseriaceae bacterium TC5R-5]